VKKDNKVARLVKSSGKKKSQLIKDGNIPAKTLDNWCSGRSDANTSLIKLILACSKNDKELLLNIKLFE